MERGKNPVVNRCIAQAWELLLTEEIEAAYRLVEAALADHDHVRLWRFKKRVLLMLGDEPAAELIMRRIVDHIHMPTATELALIRSEMSSFTALKIHKLLYLHVPKCGSTTVKDMLYHILTGERGEGHSHSRMLEQAPYRMLVRAKLPVDYADWFRFLVVRDPISRLRSYYRFNLVFTDDLSKEVGKRESFMGLRLQPTYDQFLKNLHRYRQVFPTLRAHTNPLSDIAGDDPSVYDWVGLVARMDELRAKLSEKTNTAIPAIHNFHSKNMVALEPTPALEEQVRPLCARDYEIYGCYF
ncbi:sulfotransferase family protein [Kordiimonas aestuarii]|uniref:sulfotransferase family protein n=1 Tax=Kordiimonas aestuarii TaxID=1005925 RepID=UPI0021CE1B15|nr:sulfotransferase family protein [Kordiimonas aestuarii]